MRLAVVARVMGLLLIVFSSVMLPSLALAWFEPGDTFRAFLAAAFMTLLTGALLYLPFRRAQRELRLRDGFVIVTLFWSLLALFGALPFMFAGVTAELVDAYFETMSGLTTTGSSVLSGLDQLPASINLWRGLLHLLGGMGIVVLAVAILPLLGVGGMQLYKAETPGPMKEAKLTPRIRETAKALWYIYLGLIVACAGSLWLAGMPVLDALIHSFSTISTGGFSNHDASVGYYKSPLIEMIVVLFMVLGGTNFALHFVAFRRRELWTYWRDSEWRIYLGILVGTTLFIAYYLVLSGTYTDPWQALRYGAFNLVSMATTTGFASTDFGAWPPVIGGLMVLLCCFTGMAGSTAGGIKLLRIVVLFRQSMSEFKRLIHPNAIVTVKLSARPVPDRTIAAISAFLATYLAVFVIIAVTVAALGVDLVTAFTATAATVNGTGPGLGAVGPASNFAGLPYTAKWVLSFAMLTGRLELFTLLVLFTPAFWRG